MRFSARSLAPALAASLLLSPSSFAFDTPLSDQAVRELRQQNCDYFVGERGWGVYSVRKLARSSRERADFACRWRFQWKRAPRSCCS